MSPQGIFNYGRLQGFTSASFTLSHGTTPSIAIIYIPPNFNIVIPPVSDLSISFGNMTLNFPDCRFRRPTMVQQDDGSEQWGIEIEDARWKWAQGQISGFYNVTLGEHVKTIKQGTEKSPQDLFKLCFEALGFPARKLDVSAVPNLLRPEVAWEYYRIDQAIDQLCQLTGTRCVFLPGNFVKIQPQGIGQQLRLLPYTNFSRDIDQPVYPDELWFVGDRERRIVDIPLESIGREPGGDIKAMDKVSYKPRNGWEQSDNLFFGDLSIHSAIREAEETIYRWWRPVIPFKIPASEKLPEIEITSLDQILPLLDSQTNTQDIGSAITAAGGQLAINRFELPAQLWGVYWNERAGTTSNAAPGDEFDADGNPIKDNFPLANVVPGLNLSRYPQLLWSGFQIDRERGIVMTDQQALIYDGDFVFKQQGQKNAAWWSIEKSPPDRKIADVLNRKKIPAILYLRVAVQYREGETLAWVRSVKKERLRKIPLGTGPKIIRRDDIGLRSTMFHLGLRDEVKYKDNHDEWDKRAKYYLDAAKMLIKPEDSMSANYCGLLNVQPDGAIQQVTWYVADDGFCFTRASRNREESLIVPSFEQRIMLNQIRADMEAKMRATGQPKK